MDAVHFHLLANHVPLILITAGFFLLIRETNVFIEKLIHVREDASGMLLKRKDLTKAALVIFFISGPLTIPVYLSGEGAEEAVEDLPGVSESFIHEHEEAAEAALLAAVTLSVVSAAAFFAGVRKMNIYPIVVLVAMVCSFAVICIIARTAYLGGQIRHTEIRPSGPASMP